MDVLEYYTPSLNWDHFVQGGVSDDVWRTFKEVLLLCHAYKHWRGAAQESRRERPPPPFYKESAYQRRKRRQGWEAEIKGHENHMYRAAFLAAQKLWDIAGMVQQRKDTADWHFSLALMKAVGAKAITNTMSGHERADFDVLAFNSFDAGEEISTHPDAMAERWRAAAGYSRSAA